MKKKIKKIIIPEGTSDIKEYNLAFNRDIVRVSIPGTVKRIDDFAFAQCLNLKSIEIGDGVEEIGECAFMMCYKLKSIKLPKSIKKIGLGAFDVCKKLKSVEIDNQFYTVVDGILYDKEQINLFLCPMRKKGEVVIPNTVKYIQDSAFMFCKRITKLYLPKDLVSIGREAFRGCNL